MRRAAFLLAACATLPVLALPATSAGQEPADADLLRACVEEVAQEGRSPAECDGRVSSPCLEGPDAGSTLAMSECLAREATAWDVLLNEDYQRLMERLDAEQQQALREAQRAWIAFRDADCAFPDVLIRGSLARIYGPSCLSDHTMRRVVDLRGYLGVLDGY